MPVAFGSISSAVVASGTLTVTAPTGITNGDVLVTMCGTTAADTTAIGLPAGFTEVAEDEPAIGGPRFAWGSKIASGESGDYSFTFDGANTRKAGVIVRLTGNAAVSPVDASGYTLYEQVNENPADVICPAVTTTVGDCLILRLVLLQWGADNGDGLVIQTAGYTERADVSIPDVPNAALTAALYTIDTNQAAVGTTGTAAVRSSVAGNKQGVGITIAISPLAGGRGPIFGFGGGLGEWTRRFWNTGRN